MTEPINESCKLCRSSGRRQTDHLAHWEHIWTCRCGDFFVDRCDYEDFLARDGWLEPESRRELSALLREQNVRYGRSVFLQIKAKATRAPNERMVTLSYEELAATWPQSVAERLDRVLLNLAALSPTGGTIVDVKHGNQQDLALVFSRNDNEGDYHVKALVDLLRVQHPTPGEKYRVLLTPSGWARVSELQSEGSSRRNPVFVAMWFGDAENKAEMDGVWSEIRGACVATGWKAIRANSEPHSDFIMNKVLGDIRRSPFVIADFTRNRNGVYLEAGFARGLGIPVVHTCKAEDFGKAHFDIKQINTIKWTTVGGLREGVTQWIRATMGEGPEPIPNPTT